jgi:hypothetical protein
MTGHAYLSKSDIYLSSTVVIRWTDHQSVRVEGIVHSLADHEAALRAAWNTTAVRRVEDCLSIRLMPPPADTATRGRVLHEAAEPSGGR